MEWITVLTAIITLLIAITGYFIKNHIENVENGLKRLTREVSALKQDSLWLQNNFKDLRSSINDSKSDYDKKIIKIIAALDNLKEQRDIIHKDLEQHEQHLENYGKVIRAIALKLKKES
jgi:uncharacterized coiled-coil DUF342 family protein